MIRASAEVGTAVVTGAASGIGAAAAAALVDRGWVVHGADRTPTSCAAGCDDHVVDVTDEHGLVRLAESLGSVDALVTAAGVLIRPGDGSTATLDLTAWERTLAVNVTGTMLTVRAFAGRLSDGGAVVTVGSVAGISAMVGVDAYTASKGAVVALTRALAVDYSRRGIRVNCVCPGPTDTAMMQRVFADREPERRLELPQQRMATASEVAAVIAFLASPEASYVSGAIVPVDGAATANTAGMPFPRLLTDEGGRGRTPRRSP